MKPKRASHARGQNGHSRRATNKQCPKLDPQIQKFRIPYDMTIASDSSFRPHDRSSPLRDRLSLSIFPRKSEGELRESFAKSGTRFRRPRHVHDEARDASRFRCSWRVPLAPVLVPMKSFVREAMESFDLNASRDSPALISRSSGEEKEPMDDDEMEGRSGEECDPDYEFDAARFYDFRRSETCSEAEAAEHWFESAGTYPPSRKHRIVHRRLLLFFLEVILF